MTATELERYRKTIADSVVLQQLPAADLESILGHCQLVEVAAGQAILSEGQMPRGLYIILSGNVEFFLPEDSPAGKRRPTRVRLNVLGPGRCFGEYGVIDDRPCSASARAVAPTKLCLLPREEFRRITNQDDRVGRIVYANLLRFLIDRLRAKDKELDLIVLEDHRRE